MQVNKSQGEGAGVVSLLTETMDGLSRLVAEHIKLAKLEFFADARVFGKQIATAVIVVPFLLLGYAILCLGLAVSLSPSLGLGTALVLVGGVHLVGGVVALFIAVRKLRDLDWMGESVLQAEYSLALVKAGTHESTVPQQGESNSVSPLR